MVSSKLLTVLFIFYIKLRGYMSTPQLAPVIELKKATEEKQDLQEQPINQTPVKEEFNPKPRNITLINEREQNTIRYSAYSRTIYIDDVDWTPGWYLRFTEVFNFLQEESEDPIIIDIQSMGGSLEMLNRFLSTLVTSKVEIITIASFACSAGFFTLQAGKYRLAMPAAFLMVHDVRYTARGDSVRHDIKAKESKLFSQYAWELLEKRSGMTKKEVEKKYDRDRDFGHDAKTALELNFIDGIVTCRTNNIIKFVDKLGIESVIILKTEQRVESEEDKKTKAEVKEIRSKKSDKEPIKE